MYVSLHVCTSCVYSVHVDISKAFPFLYHVYTVQVLVEQNNMGHLWFIVLLMLLPHTFL